RRGLVVRGRLPALRDGRRRGAGRARRGAVERAARPAPAAGAAARRERVVGVPVDLRCSDLTAVVTDYLEAALTADETIDVEQHLLICDGCFAVGDRMRTTIGLLAARPRPALSPGARAALLAAGGPADPAP